MRERDSLADKESEPSVGGAGIVWSLSSPFSLLCGNVCVFYLDSEEKRCAIDESSVL